MMFFFTPSPIPKQIVLLELYYFAGHVEGRKIFTLAKHFDSLIKIFFYYKLLYYN